MNLDDRSWMTMNELDDDGHDDEGGTAEVETEVSRRLVARHGRDDGLDSELDKPLDMTTSQARA
ncbi:hypothetical protein KFK09_007416 [Dendrobium nobile]|uniref:Uncharacterized protein n=1 Tax=Dendrobium nobile TaxID=94219 RepID=A0A8T3BWT5_DENNO|nr:hypothetical protein KFK09_007416 [Dendrobium nobile]